MQQLDFQLGLDVDLVVVLGGLTIDILLPILAHHDEGRRVGGLERERQIEQNKRIGIPPLNVGGDVEGDPKQEKDGLDDDECPRAHRRRDAVRNPLSSGERRRRQALLAPAQTPAQYSEFGKQAFFRRLKLDLQVLKLRHGVLLLTEQPGRASRERRRAAAASRPTAPYARSGGS